MMKRFKYRFSKSLHIRHPKKFISQNENFLNVQLNFICVNQCHPVRHEACVYI
jgi:hypothetical protein